MHALMQALMHALMQGFSGADLASLMREAAMCALKESLAKDRANLGQVTRVTVLE